jgi:hypothetical protein
LTNQHTAATLPVFFNDRFIAGGLLTLNRPENRARGLPLLAQWSLMAFGKRPVCLLIILEEDISQNKRPGRFAGYYFQLIGNHLITSGNYPIL